MITGGALNRHALRTAVVSVVTVAALVVLLCVAVDLIVASSLRSSAAARLTAQLTQLAGTPGGPAFEEPDLDDPLLVWQLNASGVVVRSTAGAPALPETARKPMAASAISIAGNNLLIASERIPDGLLVGAVSLANESSSLTTLVITEAVVGPILLALVFGGAFMVGRNVAGPIERARRRQLEFTADASHELRTPLAVIEAETSLALAHQHEGSHDTATLERVAAETRRMRTIVEDLLWLARFDSMPPDPAVEPVDLATAAEVGVGRFVSIADQAGVHLDHFDGTGATALIDAPAEWVDRLIGVVLDNACRYTPSGGKVTVSVARDRSHARLTVCDTGPGIPVDQRTRIFERFHRATVESGGAGLGLTIGNAIVAATQGRWQIDEVPGGGASVGVVWPLSRSGLVGPDDPERGPGTLGDGASRVPE